MADTTSSAMQLVQDTSAVFGRGDTDAVSAMHADIDWHKSEHSPWHAPRWQLRVDRGPDQRVRTNPRFLRQLRGTPDRVHDAGETVSSKAGTAPARPGSPSRSASRSVQLWTVRDGKLAEFQQSPTPGSSPGSSAHRPHD